MRRFFMICRNVPPASLESGRKSVILKDKSKNIYK